MPEAYLVLCGASLVAPLILFGIVIWTGIERQRALVALERRVRERFAGPRQVAPIIRLAATTGTPPSAPMPGGSRTAA